jgi:hypothetical protein
MKAGITTSTIIQYCCWQASNASFVLFCYKSIKNLLEASFFWTYEDFIHRMRIETFIGVQDATVAEAETDKGNVTNTRERWMTNPL